MTGVKGKKKTMAEGGKKGGGDLMSEQFQYVEEIVPGGSTSSSASSSSPNPRPRPKPKPRPNSNMAIIKPTIVSDGSEMTKTFPRKL